MSAFRALKAARAAGIHLEVDGDGLVLEATSAPPAAVLEAISRHKTEIVALLRPGRDGWSAEDWQIFFDKRAGIAEFDGELPRPEAEVRAYACCVAEWLNRNPERSQPGCCLACGGREKGHDALLPFGIEPAGHVWLHGQCWPAWYGARKAKAASALKVMGIVAPVLRPTTKRLSSIDGSGQSRQKTYLPACGK
jgi:hypothetical protein